MLSLTARTPTFRREDIASRLLIFYLDRLVEKRPEHELFKEVQANRNALMSDYARMLNSVLRVTASDEIEFDPGIRLADFARVAARIGTALESSALTKDILDKIRRSQYIYATEENPLYLAIDIWLTMRPLEDSQLGLHGATNSGRKVTVRQLYGELKTLADTTGIRWPFKNEISMGMTIKNMADELGMHFDISSGRDGRKRWYRIEHRQGEKT